MRSPKDTVALVTGANSGIGKATAVGLAKWGAQVTLLVRSIAKGKATMDEIKKQVPGSKLELLVADLSSQRSIRAAADSFLKKNKELHILVNAAGVFVPKKVVTEDGLESTMAVNYVAYWLLSNLLLPALKKGAPSRVVNVSSRYGGAKIDLEDLNFDRRNYSYMKATPPTMLMRVLFTQELAERLTGTGVVVSTVHPGLVANTQLLSETGGFFRWLTNRLGKSAEVGADTVLWLATSPEAATVTGKMFAKRKEMKTPGQGSDPKVRKALWAKTEALTATSAKR
ncbi:MAG TPA: SDR family NAD(P)-dependent oxidoreductase [Candidatus Thermoplasmatota archaeon]